MTVDKKINYEIQGGVKNYTPSKMVEAPVTAKSSPNTPTAHLAYITPEEEKILIDLNLYGSLKGKPNRGPSGIPSLEGDFGGPDGSGGFKGGGDYSSAEAGDFSGFDGTGSGPDLPPGVSQKGSKEARDIRNSVIAAGLGQRVNPGFFDSKNTVSPAELAAARRFDPISFGKSRSRGIMDLISGGGLFGNLIRGLGQKLGYGKTYDEPTYDMSEFNQYELGGSQTPTYYNDLDNELMEEIGAIRPTQTFSFDNTGMMSVPNNLMSEVTRQDLKRQNQIQALDYETARDIGVINPNMTEYEFEQIKEGAITEPGTYTA